MSSSDLPKDAAPLTPLSYWQESVAAWTDFSQRASKLMMSQVGTGGTKLDSDTDTLTGEILRTLSDYNLRHWQNTARLLESLPAWMQMPNNMTGSALVDWFDTLQRQRGALVETLKADPVPDEPAPPRTLAKPEGQADDLTLIKGIGPKLSALLNELGIYHFKQIADWSDAEARWVDDYLSYKGRVAREKWIPQALSLMANGSATVH